MELRDVESLPPTLDTHQAAEILGCSADHLWALVREDQAPIEPLRLGRKLRWPTARLLALVGIDPTSERGTTGACTPVALAAVSTTDRQDEGEPHDCAPNAGA
jgi:predicted DNA-binding transcriptional regulator AlpA